MSKHFWAIFALCILHGPWLYGIQYLDSLNLGSKDIKNPKKVLEAYEDYYDDHFGYYPETCKEVSEEMLHYALKHKLDSSISLGYNLLGTSFQFLNNFDTAIYFHRLGLKYALKSQSLFDEGKSYNLLGNGHIRLSNYDSAALYYNKALFIAEKTKNKKLESSLLTNLSFVYKRTKQNKKAGKALMRSVKISLDLKDSNSIVNSYMSIGNNHWETTFKLDSIVYYYKKALSYVGPNINPRYARSLYDNLSLLYFKLGDLKLALKYSDRCKPYIDNVKDYKAKSRYFHQRSLAFSGLGYPEGKSVMDSCYKYALLSQDLMEIGDASEGLFKYYFYKNNQDSGEYYLEIFVRTRDSIYSLNSIQSALDAEAKFKSDKLSLEKENIAKKLSNEKLQKNRVWLLLILCLVVFTAIFFGLKSRIRKVHLEKKKRELEFQEELVSANIKSQEEERSKIARELHDGINQQIAGVKIGIANITENLDKGINLQLDKLNSLQEMVTDVSSEVRNLSHQLIPSALLNGGLQEAVQDLVYFYNNNQAIQFEYSSTYTDLKLNKMQETHIFRIIQELVNNIIKHSKATKAEIQFHKMKDCLLILVSDDGIGFTQHKIKSGIGLENIKSRINLLHGDIVFEKEVNGSLIRITVPKDAN